MGEAAPLGAQWSLVASWPLETSLSLRGHVRAGLKGGDILGIRRCGSCLEPWHVTCRLLLWETRFFPYLEGNCQEDFHFLLKE